MPPRKSPTESATIFPVGTVRKGNDDNYWIVKSTKNGVQRWIKAKGKYQIPDDQPKEIIKEIEVVKTDDDDIACVICLENRKEELVLPCGHLVFCAGCRIDYTDTKCPTCRKPFTQIKHIYL